MWHRPSVRRLTVSLDTAFGGTSGIDGELGEFTEFSDGRLKQEVLPLANALGRLSDLNGSEARRNALVITLLAAAIQEQQGLLMNLNGSIQEHRRKEGN